MSVTVYYIQNAAVIATPTPDIDPTIISSYWPQFAYGDTEDEELRYYTQSRTTGKTHSVGLSDSIANFTHYTSQPLICQMGIIIPVSWWC